MADISVLTTSTALALTETWTMLGYGSFPATVPAEELAGGGLSPALLTEALRLADRAIAQNSAEAQRSASIARGAFARASARMDEADSIAEGMLQRRMVAKEALRTVATLLRVNGVGAEEAVEWLVVLLANPEQHLKQSINVLLPPVEEARGSRSLQQYRARDDRLLQQYRVHAPVRLGPLVWAAGLTVAEMKQQVTEGRLKIEDLEVLAGLRGYRFG